ncbi:hypothetical protein [Chryseobacterium luquanense]|uniref:Uncharacterized protein n=1 Tax=Chryseobacterium luquanense TaxID=2983766 RepID=A0ABT3Y9C8_9FLAO|nr:hypothetical protein [Chryseobacterium luquanense]MCX8534661.1 hypothetical protein [Chryseobacterium luquanense]
MESNAIWLPDIITNAQDIMIREPDLPTFSQAPDKRMPSTIGAAIQNYRDSGPLPTYGTMGASIVAKGLIDGVLDLGNFARNSFFNQADYSGLGPRITKWDGNTMSVTESQDAKFNALLTADGLVTAGLSSSFGKTSLPKNTPKPRIDYTGGIDFSDPLMTFYHKGELNGGVLDPARGFLSTGRDFETVNVLNRTGKVWKIEIRSSLFEKWEKSGVNFIERRRDLDDATGIYNKEIRFKSSTFPTLQNHIKL